MASAKSRRVVIFNLLCVLPLIFAQDYTIPNVSIQALRPKGVRISIPGDAGTRLFVFQGNINRQIGADEVGIISAEITPNKNKQFVYEDLNVKLNVGDIIYYYVHIVRNRVGYHADKLSYTIQELVDTSPSGQLPNRFNTQATVQQTPQPSATSPMPPSQCISSPTSVFRRDASLCSGDIIFHDDFDTLRTDIWTIEQYIPTGPEYPFVSYQHPPNASTLAVQEGILRITPQLQQTLPGFDGDSITANDFVLNLQDGCTRANMRECSYTNAGAQIMPPIASGRITSSMFSFKYGVIEVRAKLPQGDWLYPDILLESLLNKYGPSNYASGTMRIAGALGNLVLSNGAEDCGNKVLYGGPIMNFKCRKDLLRRTKSDTPWGNDFHVYSLRWAQESITMYVDGLEYGSVEPTASGLHTRLSKILCDPPRQRLQNLLAPFDDFFRITLGVSAGGISEFPDKVIGPNIKPKPWKDSSSQAKRKFIEDQYYWYPTWTNSGLHVDYITVRAL